MQKESGDEPQKKREVCDKIIRHLVAVGHPTATTHPAFVQELHAYFATLPTRYALDVNVERAEDLLVHKQLSELAKVPENRPAFSVRAVQVLPVGLEDHKTLSSPSLNGTLKQEDFLGSIGHSAPKQSLTRL